MIYHFEQGSSDTTWVLFHGTGGNEHDLIPLAKEIDPKANIISFRGRVNEQGMNRFFKRISPGVFDLNSLRQETQFILGFIEELAQKHHLNHKNMVLLGYSNGANMIGSILLHQDNLFTKAILIRPMVPLRDAPYHELSTLNALILSGKYDPIVPNEEVYELDNMLKTRHSHVTLVWSDLDHRIDYSEVETIKVWYKSFKLN